MSSNPDLMTIEFLHYNRWANLRLIDACLSLPVEMLELSAPGIYGSIYETLAHIVRSEASYCRRITGERLEPPFDWKASPPLTEIRGFAEKVGAALVDAAGQLSITDSLPRTWDDPEWAGFPPRFRVVGLLIQVVDHGIEHRTNVTTLLAQQGIETPGLDGWEYMLANPDWLGAA